MFAQPSLDIEPRRVTFENIFNRYDYTNLINKGNQVLRIDSLSLTKSFYIIDFENAQQLPLFINPDDTVKVNITLTNFYNITVSDTTDTIWVYSNDPESPRDLRIQIDFFDDDYGTCSGIITDEILAPIPNSKIYFFYYGIYLFDSTFTDISGNYTKQLPKGDYTVAAEKEGYRVMFSGNTPDPYFAQSVALDSGQAAAVDIQLPPVDNSEYSISGTVIDSVYGNPINKGIVIVRKGTHTPTLLKQNALISDSSVYAGFVKPDGRYNIVVEDSTYYFVQAYSSYYLPTYYNTQNSASVFWQNADSVFINQTVTDRNLYLERDSSYGGGGAYGYISVPFFDGRSYDGITILAKSLANNQLYSYNFGKDDGRFYLNNLPYGTYQLVAQKIGFPNAVSNQFVISALNPVQNDLSIQFTLTDVVNEDQIIPSEIKLYPNFPNPFNPSTKIGYSINSNQFVSIIIYDVLGKEIETLVHEEKPTGFYELNWNAENLTSGVYFYQLRAGNFVETRKMILLK